MLLRAESAWAPAPRRLPAVGHKKCCRPQAAARRCQPSGRWRSDSSSAGDSGGGTVAEAVSPRPSFLSLLTEGHGIHLLSFNDAGQYLNVIGAPLLAQNVRHEPDFGAAGDLCACLERIARPNGAPYAALPDKARETHRKLLGLEPHPSLLAFALALR
jgi:hypothetical protein